MNAKAAKEAGKGPADRKPGASPKPVRQGKARAESPAAGRLQRLQGAADAAAPARQLRQLQKIAYRRPNAGALRQLSGVIQRQRANGQYQVNANANLRNNNALHGIIQAVPAGQVVTVIDNAGRNDYFTRGVVIGKKHHSWVRLAGGAQGWIEDSKLTPHAAAAVVPPVVVPPVLAPPVVVAPPVVAAPVVPRLAIGRETPDSRSANDKLHTAGLAANVAAPAGPLAVAAAVLAIRGGMGGGGDVGVSARKKVQNLVTLADNNLYDITNATVQDKIKWLAYAMTTATHTTTIGERADHLDSSRGMGFFNYDKMY